MTVGMFNHHTCLYNGNTAEQCKLVIAECLLIRYGQWLDTYLSLQNNSSIANTQIIRKEFNTQIPELLLYSET